MAKMFLQLSAAFGALAVAIGAFGAHGLRTYLESVHRLETFETAVKYHFYHALALFMLGLLCFHIDSKGLEWAGWSFVAGILIFSGSLYALCLTGVKILGAITPIGGLLFILGWILMAVSVGKSLN